MQTHTFASSPLLHISARGSAYVAPVILFDGANFLLTLSHFQLLSAIFRLKTCFPSFVSCLSRVTSISNNLHYFVTLMFILQFNFGNYQSAQVRYQVALQLIKGAYFTRMERFPASQFLEIRKFPVLLSKCVVVLCFLQRRRLLPFLDCPLEAVSLRRVTQVSILSLLLVVDSFDLR